MAGWPDHRGHNHQEATRAWWLRHQQSTALSPTAPALPVGPTRATHARRCCTALQPGSCISWTSTVPWSQERARSFTAGSTSAVESTYRCSVRVPALLRWATTCPAVPSDLSRRSSNSRRGSRDPSSGSPSGVRCGVGHRARRRRCPGCGAVSGCSGDRAIARSGPCLVSPRRITQPGWPSASRRCRFRSCTTDRSAVSPKPSSGGNSTGSDLAQPQLGVHLAQGRVEGQEGRPAPGPPRAGPRRRDGAAARRTDRRSARAETCTRPKSMSWCSPTASDDRLRLRGRRPGVDVGPRLVGVRCGQDHAPGHRPALGVALRPDHQDVLGDLAGRELPVERAQRVAPGRSWSRRTPRRRAGRRCSVSASRRPSAAHQSQNAPMSPPGALGADVGRTTPSEPAGVASSSPPCSSKVSCSSRCSTGTPSLRRARWVQSTWKNSLTTCGRVRMMTSRASTSATLATSARIGSLVTGSPTARPPAASIALTVASTPGAAGVQQLLAQALEVGLVDRDRRGGEHLSGGQRAHGALHAGRGVLDGQHHVVADRVLDVLVQAPDVRGVCAVKACSTSRMTSYSLMTAPPEASYPAP